MGRRWRWLLSTWPALWDETKNDRNVMVWVNSFWEISFLRLGVIIFSLRASSSLSVVFESRDAWPSLLGTLCKLPVFICRQLSY